MAILFGLKTLDKTCWACGAHIEDEDTCIMMRGGDRLLYLHADCGQSVSRRLLDDLNELGSLGLSPSD